MFNLLSFLVFELFQSFREPLFQPPISEFGEDQPRNRSSAASSGNEFCGYLNDFNE
jgi:hypothetical protein